MSGTYIPRFAFEITEEQKERADRLFSDHGFRRAVFTKILDNLLDLVEDKGKIILGLIATGEANSNEILRVVKQAERLADKK